MEKIALVTGSTSGIGLGVARSLAEAGYRVVLNGFGTPDTIDSVLSEIGSLSSSEPIYIGTDLTDVVSIEKAINELLSSEGPVCVLVNNAGSAIYGTGRRISC